MMLLWRWLNGTISLPEHCEPQNRLLSNLSSSFDTCIPTSLALLSTILGSCSICAWLFAQLPQIYKNWKLKSTAGLSIYFLVEWCLGDTANLIGAILTKQATWQVMVAAYYTFVDCILVSQFIYFTYFLKKEDRWMAAVADDVGNQGPGARGDGPLQALNPKPSRAVNISRDPIFDTFRFPTGSPSPREKSLLSTSRPLVNSASSGPTASPKTVILVCTLLAVLAHASPLPSAEAPSDHLPPPASSTSETAGQIISWFSTFLYLGSRLPQLIKNHRRKSTSGLSASLFIAAFFGNLFYSSSLLSNPLAWGSYGPHGLYGWAPPEGSDRSKWVALATPFFLGAAGVLALDAAVGMQFLMYGEGSEEQARKKLVEYRDDTGARHWRKVSGWMRGWVPSPRLRPVRTDSVTSFGGLGDAVVNDQRPLLDRDDEEDSLAGRNYGSGGRAR